MSILNSAFEKVYVINLKSRPDRAEHFAQQAQSISLSYEMIEAVDGTEHCRRRRMANPRLHAGRIGCKMSHLSAVRKAEGSRVKSVLVLEDDLVFPEGFEDSFAEFYSNVPQDWNMLHLYRNETSRFFQKMKTSQVNQYWNRHSLVPGAVAVAYRDEVYQTWLKAVEKVKDGQHFDLQISIDGFYLKPNVRSYSASRNLVEHVRVGKSNTME